jgi:hypothetical protein
MKKLLGLIVCTAFLFSCNDKTKTTTTTDSKPAADQAVSPRDYEFADTKFIDIAKKHIGYLESGDIDAWMTSFADNAIYRWNNLDSLVGKVAITDYWKKRRTDVIESISFKDDIWLPVTVFKPQAPGHLTGNYALAWYMVTTKYKMGKSMTQRIHTIFHFNENDQVDRVSQYLDRAPIMAAMEK